MVQKLEPLLKSGLSIRKACDYAQIPRSTFYKLYDENEAFMYQINSFLVDRSHKVNKILNWRLVQINEKIDQCQRIEEDLKKKGITDRYEITQACSKYYPTHDEWKFLQWLATNANDMRDEFGNRTEINAEIRPSRQDTLTEDQAANIVETINQQIEIMRANDFKAGVKDLKETPKEDLIINQFIEENGLNDILISP